MTKSQLANLGQDQGNTQVANAFDPSNAEEDGIFRVNSLQVEAVNREELA